MPLSFPASFRSIPSSSAQIQHPTTGQSHSYGPDPYKLQRFLDAQKQRDSGRDLIDVDINSGQVQHDWMWYVFPQVKGLGNSALCNDYGINSLAEAEAFFKHPVLGKKMMERLDTIDHALRTQYCMNADIYLGKQRAPKLAACLTLMFQATGDKKIERFLKDHFGSNHEPTMKVLRGWQDWHYRQTSVDPYNLERFFDRDPKRFDRIVQNLSRGSMELQSLPYIFPRMRRAGETQRMDRAGMTCEDEMWTYAYRPELRRNLNLAMDALLANRAGVTAQDIFGKAGATQVEASMRFINRSVDLTDLFDKSKEILERFFGAEDRRAPKASPSVADATTARPHAQPDRNQRVNAQRLPAAHVGTSKAASSHATLGQTVPFNPERFLKTHGRTIDNFVNELRAGRKQTHCMWYAFPQLEGLGKSKEARTYALRSMDDARLYLAEPLLRRNYERCLDALMDDRNKGRDALSILVNPIDVQKLQSSLTLFRFAADDDTLITKIDDVLARYFGHHLCQRTRDACLNQSMSR
ncbi:DUF1810 family protein [Roseateles noduli]|uniref:DUF1810 family protein n=1 Tax=Roseateles noduli TaxID=2052484 RepID=UPI003D653657